MFDFRYHALTLVAVFVALVIGLLLGVAIGDQGLVSGAEQDLRQSLRGDVTKARAEAQALRDELAVHREYEEQTFVPLVAGHLDNRRIALIFVGARDDRVFRGVRDAVVAGGGELSFVTTLRAPLELDALARLAVGTRYEDIAQEPELLGDLGERIGEQIIQGGRLIGTLRPELLSSSNGELTAVEGVVIARSPAADRLEGAAAQHAKSFVDGLTRGLRLARAPAVGVEQRATDPSQVRWYVEHELASVDNVDQVAGMASLVFALAGEADGHYGVKSTADALLPDALTGRGTPTG
ncbi:MAG: hypothetical protein QOI64_119 [Solirubrobacteraceae bacterium]|nr:hypothetical protein [Solirubrobacteraceae bacterium]